MSWLFHPRTLLTCSLLLAISPTAWLGWKLSARQTGPHTLQWIGPKGKPLFGAKKSRLEVSSCQGDEHFKTLSQNQSLWTVCAQGIYTFRHNTRFQHGVFVRMDLKQQTAHAAWPFPAKQPLYRTLGLLPSTTGSLALLYRSQNSHGSLVVGIAGPKGWHLPPTPLPSPWEGRLLGMRWDKEALEAVVTSSHPMDRFGLRSAPAIFRFQLGSQGKWTTTQTILPYSQVCQGRKPCRIQVAYSTGPNQPWNLIARHKQLWNITVQKTKNALQFQHKKRPDWNKWAAWLRRKVSFASIGLLPRSAAALTYRWKSKGAVEELDSLHGWDKGLQRQIGHFVVENGMMRLRIRWSHAPFASIHRLQGKRIRLNYPRRSKPQKKRFEHIKKFAKPVLVPQYPAPILVEQIDTWRTFSLGAIARFAPRTCSELYNGAWATGAKRRWLVSTTGCYLTLDTNWKRLDTLPLQEHLRRRSLSLQQPLPRWLSLLWLLAGGPLSLLLGWLGARFTQTEGMQKKASKARASWWALVATTVFWATSPYFWWQWLSLL